MYLASPNPPRRPIVMPARPPVGLRASAPSVLWLPSSSSLIVPARPAPLRRSTRQVPRVGGWANPHSLMRGGLGQTSTGQTIESIASTGASATISTLVALGTITGPVGAAIAGVVAAGMAIASLFKGCGQTCVAATNIANQVGTVLTQNLNQYMSAPVHYASMQAAALNNFDTAWAALVQACSSPSLAAAGQRCISDRQQGSCAYKASEGGWQQGSSGAWTFVPWGANGSGTACWNWFVGMRDPIANDPTVVPDPPASGSGSSVGSSITSGASSVLQAVGVNPNTTVFGIPLSSLAIPAAIALVALIALGRD